ncbi:MAG: cupin [Anaerolineae bacterium]|jgi:transcriptional regulator with XRE-family HTH domain|nr:MAG: cupin [Anaerolineae bacterium]
MGSKQTTGLTFAIGTRIKNLRIERKLSLHAVSKVSGISVNALSRIERNVSLPSISTLHKIAEALNVSITHFFQDRVCQKKVIFCKRDQNIQIPFLRGAWQGLACEQFSGGIQPFLLTLEAGGGSGRFMMLHSGNEFVYCLEGQLEYEVEQERYLLEAGDTLLFLGHQKHRWRNAGKGPCRALIVLFDVPENIQKGEVLFLDELSAS